MKRVPFESRPDFTALNADLGFDFGEIDGQSYWCENHAYEFTESEILRLEKATNELQQMSLAMVEEVLERDSLFSLYGFSDDLKQLIKTSWDEDEFTCYGRFDFSSDGEEIKLLEYNADTPTTLLESSVIQWQWLKAQRLGEVDQFNSIHERLIEFWGRYKDSMKLGEKVHFAFSEGSLEDFRTCEYLADTAFQAGVSIYLLPVDAIGSDGEKFVDQDETLITNLFKLYPYEHLLQEEFGKVLYKRSVRLLEAPWKILWSDKAFLALLWKLNPGHPLLLPTYLDPRPGCLVQKPRVGREGLNVRVDGIVHYDGPYVGPSVFQQRANLPVLDGKFTVLGSWVIDGEAAGICCREDDCPVISNRSLFVPHYFR